MRHFTVIRSLLPTLLLLVFVAAANGENLASTAVAKVGELFVLPLKMENALQINIANLPNWLTFEQKEKTLKGIPGPADEGLYNLTLEVHNGYAIWKNKVAISVISPASFPDRLAQRIESLYNQYTPTLGSVSITVSTLDQGEYTFCKSSNSHWGSTLANGASQYRVASVSKIFTAALIIRMAEEGLLSLDDKLFTYVSIPGLKYGEEITIRQVLSHTSGLTDHLNSSDFYDKNWKSRTWTNEDILRYAARKGLRFLPGKGYGYSNTGFYILGIVAEKILQKPLADIYNEWIFKPLNLQQTFYDTFSDRDHKLKYLVENSRSYEYHLSCVGAAGSIVSTPSDIVKFGRALYEGNFIQPEYLQEMCTDIGSTVGGDKYGLGTRIWHDSGVYHFGHTGALQGYRSILLYIPECGATISLMTNTSHRGWYGLVNGVMSEVANHYRTQVIPLWRYELQQFVMDGIPTAKAKPVMRMTNPKV